MADLIRTAVAGTAEKSDILVEVAPGENGIELELTSVVIRQFGEDIARSVREVLQDMGVENARVTAADAGALDCVIRARVETAVLRGMEEN